MLRLLVVVLVLANALFFAWAQGYLASYGMAPATQSEPQRLAQQIKPEQMRVVGLDNVRQLDATAVVAAPAAVPSQSPAANSAATECLQAGVFNEPQTLALTAALTGTLPAGSWALENAIEPARWIVYMGRYASTEAAIKKRGELRGLGVPSELVRGAPFTTLAPGLSLGGFETEAAATAELAVLSRRGVKTAGIRQERTELRGQRLKLPAVSPELRTQFNAANPPLAGKALLACG
jgi:hypothetical protein